MSHGGSDEIGEGSAKGDPFLDPPGRLRGPTEHPSPEGGACLAGVGMDETEMAALESLNPLGKGVGLGDALLEEVGDGIAKWGEGIVPMMAMMPNEILEMV